MAAIFDYGIAFSRDIGWDTDAEQQQLSNKRIAIAGMGGVGGFHLLTLARLGVGRFYIADLDTEARPVFRLSTGGVHANWFTSSWAPVQSCMIRTGDLSPRV